MDSYVIMAFLMLGLALALFVAEIFIPSGGTITVAALICLAISIWSAVKAWWQTGQMVWWWSYVFTTVLLLPAVIIGAFAILPKTRFGRNLLVEPQNPEELKPYVEEEERLKRLVGKVGRTASLLNPGGIVLVDGDRFHCQSEGILLDPGTPVRVIGVKRNVLVVRQVSEDELQEGGGSRPDEQSSDFDVNMR